MHRLTDDEHRERTICCSIRRAVPDEQHLADIRTAVERAQRATLHLSELVNLFVREQLERHGACPREVFDANALQSAFKSVTYLRGSKDGSVRQSFASSALQHMATFERANRRGLTQVFAYAATNMAAVAKNNVWMHFQAHVARHVQNAHRVSANVYNAMTPSERKAAKLECFKVAADVCAVGDAAPTAPAQYHEWIRSERHRLRVDEVLREASNIKLMLKKTPERFVYALSVMSRDRERAGRRPFAIYPLRRRMVPAFIHLDERALDEVLAAMTNERQGKTQRAIGSEPFTFANVFDTRAAGVAQRWRLKACVDTDGVSVHFKQLRGDLEDVTRTRATHDAKYADRAAARKRKAAGTSGPAPAAKKAARAKKAALPSVTTIPRRGIWCIDALKHLSRSTYDVVGIDPGVHELVHAARLAAPQSAAGHVRYTLRERRRHLRTAQYAAELQQSKTAKVREGEAALADCTSRSPSLDAFKEYCACRRRFVDDSLAFYGELHHRERRRKQCIKQHQSEAALARKISSLRRDDRPLVLAYGSWGLTTSRPFQGVPPSKGVGLMRQLAKHFAVVPTPEYYTSKICSRCGSKCGPHPTLRRCVKRLHTDGSVSVQHREVRGLRVCQNEDCKLHLNRDRMGALNIATNYERLLNDEPLLRPLCQQDAELNSLQCALCPDF